MTATPGDRENQFISWASVEDADVDNSGFVRFQKALGDVLNPEIAHSY